MRYIVTRITGTPLTSEPFGNQGDAFGWMMRNNHGSARHVYRLDEFDGSSTKPSRTEYRQYMEPLERRGWNPCVLLIPYEYGRRLDDRQKKLVM